MNEPQMSETFLSAVMDTILPGEPELAGGAAPLPCATQAGLALSRDDPRHDLVLRLIARQAGGEARFVATSPAERSAVLRAVEQGSFEAFRSLVAALLQDYYEAPEILRVLGWRSGGAQPQGHLVPEADAETLRRLEKVRARGPFWREAG
ncbi:hypothetical protein SAMN05519104_0281 [Rhizobiales bacterium GAS188]|nr:hypothetical protein SAMN05519104_0281 [Rhizobiales bacterium GAS188]